ncbi:bifunctional metallophosphatase/5'-nucleotidase [Nocardioides zeicaulis]|uniref:Bifunctional metallophosphatase/5'-nucleotidase n=1 Tax=Nocardioides zeicaulis TaxID=1776857 RepID=A0ABV6E425_9ACTN
MSASRTGRGIALATSLTGLLAAPLAVLATASPAHAATATIQILGTNDFHGRLVSEGTTATTVAGAAQFAGAIEQYRQAPPDPNVDGTIFAAAGDLVGASTFESFIQQDKPTLDAMNAMGLDVSAAGNHEFDQGYSDLTNRIMKPYDATTNPVGGANWQYLAANVRKKSDNSYALPDVAASPGTSDGATWIKNVAGVNVGFVGAVTEDLPSLVSPSGIADLKITSIVDEVKTGAASLKAQGADVVVMLVHEGSATSSCSGVSDDSAFGKIVKGVGTDVNAIISGHTHLAYDCNVNGVPVVSSGQYGTNFNVLTMTVDTTAKTVSVDTHAIVPANTVALTAQAAIDKKAQVKTIVDAAVAQSDVLGAKVLGKLAGPFNRAKLANGSENRGGESTIGNLVAEVHRWATSSPEAGAAQIAFMNPGGLRQDMTGAAGGFPSNLSYKQAAVVQPFANTLVNMKMTGAQIKTVLEQQWQRDDKNGVPSRPFLRLGVSNGFFSTFDASRPEGDRITGMWLDGKAIDKAATYSVTANSFLAGGGDNFRGFNAATAKRDTGKVDLQAMVDYMAAKAATTPLAVNKDQRQVGVSWPAQAPRFYRIGQDVKLTLSSLAMSTPADAKDASLAIKAGDVALAPTPVDNTIGNDPFDTYGTSAVSVKLKGKTKTGKQMLTFTGATTGTSFSLPIEVRKAKGELKARTKPERIVAGKTRTRLKLKASALGIAKVTGKIKVKAGGKTYTVKLKKGKAFLRLDRFAKAGKKKIVVSYLGNRKIRGTKQVVMVKVHRR